MNLAHSYDEPGVPTPNTTNIDVRFVSISPFQLQIKNSNSMKILTQPQNGTIVPSLFQIASYFEDFVPATGSKKPATASSNTPFADLMLHPEKLKAALNSAKIENDTFAALRTTGQSPGKPITRSTMSKKKPRQRSGQTGRTFAM